MTANSENVISATWEFHCPRCRMIFSKKVVELSRDCTVTCPNCGETRHHLAIRDFLEYSKKMQRYLSEFLQERSDFL